MASESPIPTSSSSNSAPSRTHHWSSVVRLSCLSALFLLLGLVAPASSAAQGFVPNADTGGPVGGPIRPSYQTVSRLFAEVFTGQHGEVCTELMTGDALHQTPAGQFQGPEGFNAFIGTMWTAFPDAVFVMDAVSENGRQITVRWSMTGTHLGVLDGHAASGREIALHGLALFDVEVDKISGSWIEYDRLSLIEQITSPASASVTCPECHETP